MTTGKRLAIHELHARNGAHFGSFGEWEVPLYFSSILDEHAAVRSQAGLFDISHMGEFFVSGRDAKRFLDFLLPRRMDRLQDGKALYTVLLNERGGIVDDLLVYQLSGEKFLLIVNAANIEKDFEWIQHHVPSGVELENASDRKSLLALQGPRSLEIANSLFRCDFQALRYYHFLISKTPWGELLISRTGYTGEDGLEIMGETSEAEALWKAIFEAGKSSGLEPIGFGARDTLRLEAGMLLYGQDMDDSTSPWEAGLDWTIDLEKGNFLAWKPLKDEKEKGPSRKLVGFEMIERGIPRHGCAIEKEGKRLGQVTSGSFAPTLKKNIGLAYVPTEEANVGNELSVVIRSQKLKAKIVPLPFYKRRN